MSARGTLLMIHGVGCGGDAWDVMRPGFEAAGWTCAAPTLFADKRTIEAPPADLSFLTLGDYVTAMADQARQIAEETGEKPAIIGHSMGGLIAQKLCAMGLARAGVFLTPAQPSDCRVLDLRVLFTFWNIVAANDPTRGYKVWRTGFDWGVLNAVPPARRAAIYAKARHDSGRVYRDLGEPDKDPAKVAEIDARAIAVPTLTIAAGLDRATVPAAVRKTAAKYAAVGGDFLEYPNAAHWIVDEPGTEGVVADIVRWLSIKT
jgi:pimeloyl-ACP methyl ester carboxylesterase